MATTGGTRRRYHHGDLGNALTDAATALARAGGPGAVVLREAARRVGVSATAAYRHFASHDDLMHAVKERSLQALADAMREELDAAGPAGTGTAAAPAAIARLEAIGRGYLRFALTEPGLFRAAFCQATGPPERVTTGMAEDAAFGLLGQVVDGLVTAGVMAADQRPGADLAAWATVHGLAMLLLDGPLAALPEAEQAAAVVRTSQLVVAGLSTSRAPRRRAPVRSPHGSAARP